MKTQNKQKQAIVLIHGLWLKTWMFFDWKKFLEERGYQVYTFGYATSSRPFEHNVRQLIAFINSRPEKHVHAVAHSMGGLLTVTALPRIHKPGRLVMLGSPVNGSSAAAFLKRLKWDKYLTRHASEILAHGLEKPHIERPSMMIAGDSPIGLGRFVTRLEKPNDGTVAVKETRADWIDQHQVIHTSHMRLLKNRQAQQLALNFLLEYQPQDQTDHE